MSKSVLRTHKNCLNCGHLVELNFCSKCGQENSETRKSFHYLFTHFIEDLVHYDSGLWATLKYLLKNPVHLTQTYLDGKRKKYVLPVKLFIFINFIVFFGLKILENNEISQKAKIESNSKSNFKFTKLENDSIENNFFTNKLIELEKKYTIEEFNVKFIEKFKSYFPKFLFSYMPVFAFLLWLFHNKKRWWYFDHGIFTFHFFSSILVILLISRIFEFIFEKFELFSVSSFISLITLVYLIYLFFKSHRLMYFESNLISRLKAFLLLFVNFILIMIWMLILIFIIFYSI